jgi:hypothetical protein
MHKKHQETEIRFCFRDTPKRNSVSVSETLQNGIPFPFPRYSETEFHFSFQITLLYKPQHFQREKVLELPGCRDLMDNIELVPEEFVTEENLNYDKEVSLNEGVLEDDERIKTSNLPPLPVDENPSMAIYRSPLTFDPSPPQEEGEDTQLAAANNQTKLMHWHYCLGHLPFVKLKQLALNGEIPKKLAKVKPLKCAGCLFGAMTKIPWRGRETKASHEVFMCVCVCACPPVMRGDTVKHVLTSTSSPPNDVPSIPWSPVVLPLWTPWGAC